MSASTWIDRAKTLKPTLPKFSGGSHGRWIGFDFSGAHDPRRTKALVTLLGVALISALGVAALRIDLIRTRYAVAASMEAENTLIEEQRALIARKRKFRDPTALAVEARARGFRPPAHVFSVPDPSAVSGELPAVAAGPAESEAP
jgi:hypothetical protein